VVILGFLSLACTTFWTARYSLAGVYNLPLKHAQMMEGGMMSCPMMDQMMKSGVTPSNVKSSPAPVTPSKENADEHKDHH
jgi:hypothetical protein